MTSIQKVALSFSFRPVLVTHHHTHKSGEMAEESESGSKEVQAACNKPLRASSSMNKAGGSGDSANKQLKAGKGGRERSVVEGGDVEMHGV